MEKNEFIPAGLPLLTDYTLLKTVVEYRHVISVLEGSMSPHSERIKNQVEQALKMIEDELLARELEYRVSEVKSNKNPQVASTVSGAYAL